MFIQWQPEEKKKGKNNFLKHNPASRCESGVFIQRRIGKIVIGTTWSTTLSTKINKMAPEFRIAELELIIIPLTHKTTCFILRPRRGKIL
jgi:hypothetical protein